MEIFSSRRDLRGNVDPTDFSWKVSLERETLDEGNASNLIDAVHAVHRAISETGEDIRAIHQGNGIPPELCGELDKITRAVLSVTDSGPSTKNVTAVTETGFDSIETVEIAGSTTPISLYIDRNGHGWLNVRRTSESLELDPAAQIRALKNSKWATVAQLATVVADGKQRLSVFLSMESVPMWLAGISASKVKEPARSNLVAYQKRATAVLYEYMVSRRFTQQTPVLDADTVVALTNAMDELQLRVNASLDGIRTEVNGHLDELRSRLSGQAPALTAGASTVVIDAEVANSPIHNIVSDGLPRVDRTPWQTTNGVRVYTVRQWCTHAGLSYNSSLTQSYGQIAAKVGEDLKVSPVVKGSRNLWPSHVWAEAVRRYNTQRRSRKVG